MTTFYVWGQRAHSELPTGREKWMRMPEFGVLVQALVNYPHRRSANAPGIVPSRAPTPTAAGLQLAAWCNWYAELASINGRRDYLPVTVSPNGFGQLGLYDESDPSPGLAFADEMMQALGTGLSALGIAAPRVFAFDIEGLPHSSKSAEIEWLTATIGAATVTVFAGSSVSFFSHDQASTEDEVVSAAPRAYRSREPMTLDRAMGMVDSSPTDAHFWIKPPGDWEDDASGLTRAETRQLIAAAVDRGIQTVVMFSGRRVYNDWHKLIP